MITLFGKNENRYKANLHCHSRYSDGRATVETIKEEYVKRGYSVVAFTDHEVLIDASKLCDENFVAINSCELSVRGPKLDLDSDNPSVKVVHMNFYAKDQKNTVTPFYNEKYYNPKFEDVRDRVIAGEPTERIYSHECINEMVARAHELGYLVSYNHPVWSLQNAEDYLGYEGFDFIEVHNTSCIISGFHESDHAYNDMMKAGKKIMPVATDDNHNVKGFEGVRSDSFGGWVVLDAPRLDYPSVISALEQGDFYASTGPEIHSIVLDDETGVLKVKCSPAKRVFLITQGRLQSQAFAEPDETIESASFKFRCATTRFRIRVEDEYGRCACSQIYDLPAHTPRVDAEPAPEAPATTAAEVKK